MDGIGGQGVATVGPPQGALQRVRGRAEVVMGPLGRLRDLHQSGSGKVLLPRTHGGGTEVVFLNTAGGLTGGDRLDLSLRLEPGAAAMATTQTAERAYASTGAEAEVSVHLAAGAGARLHWLPQETILFDRSRLSRRTVAEIAGDAEVILAEVLVLGRAAMGERLTDFTLRDMREVRWDGRPVWLDPLRLDARALGRAAGLGPARAVATLALLAPGAEDAVGAVRAALPGDGVEAAASAWDGRCLVRMLAPEAAPLRRAVARVLEVMRGGPLPRVWQI